MTPTTAERNPAQLKGPQTESEDHSGPGQTEGKTLARNPASPSGQFGMPVQMQADPNAPIQRKPSDEVPDLEEDTVTRINAALKAGDKRKALDLVLEALVAKDASTFNKDFLVSKQLYWQSGGDSSTHVGPKFKAWLSAELAKGPKEIKTDEKACAKYLATLTVPADMPDIRINIGEERFSSASRLYSVIRHEFIHYKQNRDNPLKYLSSSDWPSGYANPSKDSALNLMEVEAYLWEAENMAKTGIDKDPQYVWNTYVVLNRKWGGTLASESNPLKTRWKAAMANMWKTAVAGYIDRSEKLITKAGTAAMSDSDFKTLEGYWVYLEDFWSYRVNYSSEATALKPRYDKIKQYIDGVNASKAAAEFGKKLKAAETKFKAARSDYDGYNVFINLYSDWEAMDAKGQAANEAEFKRVMGVIWPGSFDMLDTTMKDLYKKDKDDGNLTGLANAMLKMLNRADKCGIDAKIKTEKQAILDKWKKDLGLR